MTDRGPHKAGRVLPRDQGGSITLSEGTGGILAACPCDDFLELYKKDITFRVETPETIDPHRINPNAPVVAAVSDRVGCSDSIIARVLLQSRDMLDSALLVPPIDKPAAVRTLHAIKEGLVACRKSANHVCGHVDRIMEEIKRAGVLRDQSGRSVPSLPQVPDLDLSATQFLISAKRAIKSICNLVPVFLDVGAADSNFDYLSKTLQKLFDTATPLVTFVSDNAEAVRYLIALRNGQEHPEPGPPTRIDNFRIQADESIRIPMWCLSGQEPRPIHSEMLFAIDLLVEIAEGMVIHLIDNSLDTRLPFVFEEIATTEVNPDMPVKYRLTLDASQLNFPTTE